MALGGKSKCCWLGVYRLIYSTGLGTMQNCMSFQVVSTILLYSNFTISLWNQNDFCMFTRLNRFNFQCWPLKIVCCISELSFMKVHLISYCHVWAFTISKHILNFFWYLLMSESLLLAADIFVTYGRGTLATPNTAVKYMMCCSANMHVMFFSYIKHPLE